MQQQLVAIREQLRQYNATVGAGSSAADTGVLLADVLEKISRTKPATGRIR
ncbi:putative phage lysis accessory protein [Klebsiella pneumoniae subsp. pneumoniae KPNIH4]|nr:putative phage lysis accessory protein [Klebsiella pneumoniae subsp. pneumoniae KPNIH4]